MTELHPQTTATCPNCGGTFACEPAGACWCKDEAFRLPMPDPGAAAKGCLCPACLRETAARQATEKTP